MGRFVNLKNENFGMLTVLSKTKKRAKDRCIIWLCKCDCGVKIEVSTQYLNMGWVTNCGNHNFIDLTKEKFGLLTVIEKTDNRYRDRSIMWRCRCECGVEKLISSQHLRSGDVKSCSIKKHPPRYDLKDAKFGKLKAIVCTGVNKQRVAEWFCKCKCGKYVFVTSNRLTSGITRSCGCLVGIRYH